MTAGAARTCSEARAWFETAGAASRAARSQSRTRPAGKWFRAHFASGCFRAKGARGSRRDEFGLAKARG
eukprot:6214371-Pleurochrysis_carterae.AAC.6